MSKPEAWEYLGKSKRTLETYVSDGLLAVSYVRGANGKTAVFQRADVERLKQDLDSPSFRAVAVREPAAANTANAATAADPQAFAAVLAQALATTLGTTLREALPAPAARVKPWLTADEAEKFSGLPKRWLLKMARDPDAGPGIYRAACVVAMNIGTEKQPRWMFNRAALAK